MIEPGRTIGILGGGQLGRMLILAGRNLGYRFHVYEPSGAGAASMVADALTHADYDDRDALARFAGAVDAITLEFENIPADAIDFLADLAPVMPGRRALHLCQHRQREKDFLRAENFPCAPFEYATSAAELEQAVAAVARPCVVKTAAFGYDGKGQIKLDPEQAIDFSDLWAELGAPERVVVEKWIHFKAEYSVVTARNAEGGMRSFPVAENLHVNHILHQSMVPARVDPALAESAIRLAQQVTERLGVVGLLAVELFLDPDERWIVNEMAPRPHNSGHYTMDGCVTSQFEQHIRAVTGLPFGSVELIRPTVMVNILGDLWADGTPDWAALLADPDTKLHLYDKGEPRPGRKMGHFNVSKPDLATALEQAGHGFAALGG